jgi:hypothetical protein
VSQRTAAKLIKRVSDVVGYLVDSSVDVVAETIDFANAICKGENVTDLPQTATCASTATGSSATPSSSGTITTGTGSQTTSTTPAAAQASSSQGAAAGYEKVGGVGLGMVVAGLVAAI